MFGTCNRECIPDGKFLKDSVIISLTTPGSKQTNRMEYPHVYLTNHLNHSRSELNPTHVIRIAPSSRITSPSAQPRRSDESASDGVKWGEAIYARGEAALVWSGHGVNMNAAHSGTDSRG